MKGIITNEKLAEVLFLQKPLPGAAGDKRVVCLNLQPDRWTSCLVGHRYWMLGCEAVDRTEMQHQMFKSLQSDYFPLQHFDIAPYIENTSDWIIAIFLGQKL